MGGQRGKKLCGYRGYAGKGMNPVAGPKKGTSPRDKRKLGEGHGIGGTGKQGES